MSRKTAIRKIVYCVIGLVLGYAAIHNSVTALLKEEIDSTSKLPSSTKKQTTVRAAGRGAPLINLRDGRPLRSVYDEADQPASLLISKDARALSLTTADFDEDGMPDLASGHVGIGGGIVTLRRGNVDAVYPNWPEAKERRGLGTFTDQPFLIQTETFALPVAPSFLGAGDFDADGHWDLVAVERGASQIYWLAGDGRGSFGEAQSVELAGQATAMLTGEINRADGLTDVVVGVYGANGAKLLVFEGPNGALKGEPETIALRVSASSLALGQFDDSYPVDLAVAAADELVIVRGRDRKLSLGEIGRARVESIIVERHSFASPIVSIATGHFIPSPYYQNDLALLMADGAINFLQRSVAKLRAADETEWRVTRVVNIPNVGRVDDGDTQSVLVKAKVSKLSTDDLVFLAEDTHQLHIITADTGYSSHLASLDVEGAPIAVLPMRLNVDALNDFVILADGQTAPSFVETASAINSVVTTTFDTGPGSIREALALGGTITFNIPGAGPHYIDIAGPLTPVNVPVVIDGTTQPGYNGTPVIVLRNFTYPGLDIRSGNSVVRGVCLTNFPTFAISLSGGGGNFIEGNYLGVAVNGTTPVGNTGSGVEIANSSNNHIGGTVAAARNVAAANGYQVLIHGIAPSTGNLIQGNYIGINAAGTTSVTAGSVGISVAKSGNTIGGTIAGARNVIAGGTGGVSVGNGNDNLVQGNYIGTDFTGNHKIIGTQHLGVLLGGDNTIGGTTSAARNIIGGYNTGAGAIAISSGNPAGLVQGNYIGVGANGTTPLPNTYGVFINGGTTNSVTGGTVFGAGNVIAYNINGGVVLTDQSSLVGNSVLGNSIYSNGSNLGAGLGLGIDLVPINAPFGVTPNDLNDPDLGPNNLQNFPVLTSAASENGITTITGTLNSNANTTYRIEFFSNPTCDSSGNGEGRTHLGSRTTSTNAANNASFSATLPVTVHGGRYITATATTVNAPLADTSEFSQCIRTTGSRAHIASDFDGDGRTDIAVYRPGTGVWYVLQSSNNEVSATRWGLESDRPVPADYDGDGRTDVAVYRPSTGIWFILQSSDNSVFQLRFGVAEDTPVHGDFDGDGRADIAVFRPSVGIWYIYSISTNSVRVVKWGSAEDKPLPIDFDGDGRVDIAVWRPSDGTWYIINSTDDSFRSLKWGSNGDKPVPGDYDGDGRADIAVWRPGNGVWYILQSSNGELLAVQWGVNGDVPQPGNFDGMNGTQMATIHFDMADYWRVHGSWGIYFGIEGDIEVSTHFVKDLF